METLFYGIEPKWFSRDIAYKLYADKGMITAIVVGRQMWNASAVRTQLSGLNGTIVGIPLVEAMAARAERRKQALEEAAERDFDAAQHLKGSRLLDLHDVRHVEISTRRSFWMAFKNAGIVTLHLRNGSSWRLLVPEGHSMSDIEAALEKLGLTLVVDRRQTDVRGARSQAPSPASEPKPPEVPLAWYQHLWLALPIVLVHVGGAIGGACGGGAWVLNVKVFRKTKHPILRYVWTGLISVGAVIAYFVIALVALSLMKRLG